MNDKRRIRLSRTRAEPEESQITTQYIERVVQETVASLGLDDFPQWKGEVQRHLHTLRVILSDMRDAAALAAANQGSAKNKIDELLEQFGIALLNLNSIMSEEDTGPSERQAVAMELLANFRQNDPRYQDPTGADVETDDFTDPLDDLL